MLASGELDLPSAGCGETGRRWAALATWGGRDLSLARLAEGHVDAVAILAEAGRVAVPGALYGVWASRSGGAAVRLEQRDGAPVLAGTMRFCSGARLLDRALVVADDPAGSACGRLLFDVDLTARRVEPVPDSWCSAAMADADTLDVVFDDVPIGSDAQVGGPGWYTARRGFALGGAGVAAVWWGGAAGVLDRVLGHLGATPDRHVLAHLGELHAALAAADALVQHTAALVDGAPPARAGSGALVAGAADLGLAVATLRSAAERAAREVVDRAPRMVGPGPLSRDAGLARALADLALYIRQHHAERDQAALGELILAGRRSA
jgi:alkylation response protein AidB-like acyl-CoA dehydrogenase